MTRVFLLKSSIKFTEYFDLDNDGMEKWPQKLVCISCNTLLAFDWDFCRINFLDYLPAMQFAQNSCCFHYLREANC